MIHLIVQVSKYLMILLLLIYTFQCFYVFRYSDDAYSRNSIYTIQRYLIFWIHLDGYLVLYLTTDRNVEIGILFLCEVAVFVLLFLMYKLFYRQSSELLLNNMLMLLVVGMTMLARLNMDKAKRQFLFIVVGCVCAVLIPVILEHVTFFRKIWWFYAIIGIGALAYVAVAGSTSYGAKLSISIAGFSIQPSEFVKLIFVFFVASRMCREMDMKSFLWTGIISAVFVLALVASRDLGGALIYFFTFLVMAYVATRKWYVFAGGIASLALASVIGYKLFSHVQTRVLAWKDPLAVYDSAGYQVSQSLFAIGTGGWFGLGLNQGKPSLIPVVEKDFIFSAISEEMGGIFALGIILICVSCFLMIFNISLQMTDPFYKLLALGLGAVYALQIFLTIGGVTKFIPSTGVTLPLVAYGGSSLLSTMLLMGIVQGLYIRKYHKPRRKKQKGEPEIEERNQNRQPQYPDGELRGVRRQDNPEDRTIATR